MQFAGIKRPPTGIVYDSDLGSGIDSVLALALLHGFDGRNEARIASLSISNPDLKAAQLCDVIEKFYASATTGIAATFLQGLPVGLAAEGKQPGDTAIVSAVLTKQDAAGKPVYSPRIHKLNDTAIPEVLMRNALSAQYEQNAVVVLAGPATNLVKLLDLPGASSLIESKVKFLVVSGGSFSTKPSGSRTGLGLLADPAAAKRLFAQWPTPIVACGSEIGTALPYPASSIEKDFAYSQVHPVPEAYRAYQAAHQPKLEAEPAPGMAAVLYAARPNEGYFQLSAKGSIRVGDSGGTEFQTSESGKHRYLIADAAQRERILKIYTELASAKPVPRTFRRPVVAENPADLPEGKKEQKLPPQ